MIMVKDIAIARENTILADAFIQMQSKQINTLYRHQFHLMPPIGWMNDPNGFSLYNQEYHLFYQFYPYDSVWGPMHWGHATTKNFVTWEHQPVALAPSEHYDKHGVFSGTALVVDNELWLYYTGVVDSLIDLKYDQNFLQREDYQEQRCEQVLESKDSLDKKLDKKIEKNISRQVQCLAYSKDGIHFQKYEHNPVLNVDKLPDNARQEDFRDPKVWRYGDKFYMITGSKGMDEIGQVLFYQSNDGKEWTYLNRLSLGREFGTVWECPDFIEIDGTQVLIISPQDMIRQGLFYENIHSSIALMGQFDYITGSFSVKKVQEIDSGFDFYAPQTIKNLEGHFIMIAWMNMWERSYVLDSEKHGWNGSMTLPRKLTMKNNHLYQWPVEAINDYRQEEVTFCDWMIDNSKEKQQEQLEKEQNLAGNVSDIELLFHIKKGRYFTMTFMTDKHSEEGISLTFDKELNLCTLNRMKTKRQMISLSSKNDFNRSIQLNCDALIRLRIIQDVSSIEVFIEDGKFVMTSLFFPEVGHDAIHMCTDGLVHIIKMSKWTLSLQS